MKLFSGIRAVAWCVLLAPCVSYAQLYFQDDFSSPDWKKNYDMTSSKNFKHRTSGCYSGGCIEITVNKGSHYGGSAKYKLKENIGFEPEEMYAEYRVRYDKSMSKYAGKAPGFDGTYGVAGWGNRPGKGTKGWSARGTLKADGRSDVRNSFYVYHTNTGNNGKTWGDARWWSGGGDMDFNRWYHVKQYVKLNTPGKANGILRAWVDGKKVFDKSDFNFRTVSSLKVYAYWINYYNGGADEAKQTGTIRIDDLKLYGVNGSGSESGGNNSGGDNNSGNPGGESGGSIDNGTPVLTGDQCNTTSQCRAHFGSIATDCKNSASSTSVCMCGTKACNDLDSGGNDNSSGSSLNIPKGWTNLQLRHSNKCLDVAFGKIENGSEYHQWSCNTGNVNQRFAFIGLGDGWYSIKSQKSGKCVDVAGGSTMNGAKIHQWGCNASNINQAWKLRDKGNGYFELISKRSNKCLGVVNESKDSGAGFVQWDCYGGENQQFKFK